MMKSSFSFSSPSSHHSIHLKPISNVVDHENEKLQQGVRLHNYDLCAREFTSGNALDGHKAFHSSNNLLKPKIQKHEHPRGIKIDTLNGHMKWHSQNGSKKGSNNYDLDQFPPIDLTKYLPQIKYETKKRSWDYILDVETINVAEIMVDMSQRSSNNLNVNYHDSKRMKLCSNVDDHEKINEQGRVMLTNGKNNEKNRLVVRLKIPKGLNIQTYQASKQLTFNDDNVEKSTEGDETDGESTLESESNFFRDLDLNYRKKMF